MATDNMLHSSNINDTTIYPPENNNIPVSNNSNNTSDIINNNKNPIEVIKKLEKSDDQNHKPHEMQMERIICDSLSSFHEFVKSQSNQKNNQVLKEPKGIIFLQVRSGEKDNITGDGIIMARLQSKNQWSGPCAISLRINQAIDTKSQFNPLDYMLILCDDQLFKTLAQNEKVKLGIDVPIRNIVKENQDDNNNNNNNNNGISSICAYLTSQSSNNGFFLEGTEIYVNDDYNKEFYTSLVDPKSILSGNIEFRNNAEYYALCNILDKYARNDYPSVDELFNKSKHYA